MWWQNASTGATMPDATPFVHEAISSAGVNAGKSQPQHSLDSDTDEDGWWWGTCACGWQQGPFLDAEDVADAYGDHRALTAAAFGIRPLPKRVGAPRSLP